MNNQRKILLLIAKAQAYSNAAKDNYEKLSKLQERLGCFDMTRSENYAGKDKALALAIKIINSTPRCGVYYFIERKDDQNGYPSNVIYFSFKLWGERTQISFHNFNGKITKMAGKGRPCHWEYENGGDVSRRILEFLGREI